MIILSFNDKIVFIDLRCQITLSQLGQAIYNFLHKSVVTIMHEQNFIQKNHLETIALQKTLMVVITWYIFFHYLKANQFGPEKWPRMDKSVITKGLVISS